ncbi:protein BRANCHLESS TRICHOME [Mercurialis annua]|uniref:protein BRANCHLESS TRICHOME n=1 Tax=Mercurialis annua TaxID=3986 RepID=UPI00215E3FDC|nr:protein BRANCHLESS TRICHOME [Mercurialis annua]
MMMMMIDSKEHHSMYQSISLQPTWKLYENPFYNSHHTQLHHQYIPHYQSDKQIHQLNLPLSARKIAASFWDLTFLKPIMETELDFARAQIVELKAELEYERKARKKGETMNKRLAKELAAEKRDREALERVCQQLAKEVSLDKSEIDRMRRDIEEERKMLRMAEVFREERVHMKLAEAKILFEEKLLQLEGNKQTEPEENSTFKIDQEQDKKKNQEDHKNTAPVFAIASKAATNLSGKFNRLFLSDTDKSSCNNDNVSSVSSMTIQRRVSPEAENPHIKRGIKGFVEFPRVVRAIGSKSRHWGTKLECQKAQLRILLRQKSPIRSNNLIIS